MRDPVLITTDLDRTLVFSQRATGQLGGALPSDPVEGAGGQTSAELSRAARDALAALPGHVRMCVATSRNLARLARLRLPFPVHYAIAANGGVILADGKPDLRWAGRIRRILAGVAPAAEVRRLLGRLAGEPWLERLAEPDDMCVLAIVDRPALPDEQLAAVADDCAALGWHASLVGRKLYAFPAGFGKEHAAAFIADEIGRGSEAAPRRLAAGDTEHDLAMLEAADLAWVPVGSDLAGPVLAGPVLAGPVLAGTGPAAGSGGGRITVTSQPGHAAAAQIAREWLRECLG